MLNREGRAFFCVLALIYYKTRMKRYKTVHVVADRILPTGPRQNRALLAPFLRFVCVFFALFARV